MIDKTKLSPSMNVEFDPKTGLYKVTNIKQGESFYTSEDLLYILESGKSFYKKKGNNYFVCDNYYGERKYFHQIAMQDKIDEYKKEYNSEPVIDHIDRDINNNSSSNLRVLSKRANLLNTEKGDKLKYFGVTDFLGSFRMYITDPYNNVRIEDYYKTREEAALAYDYYVSIYYPNETYYSNIETNRFPKSYLEEKGFNNINDIKLPESFRDKKHTDENMPYNDVYYYGHKGAEYMCKVNDINNRGSYPVGYVNSYSKLPDLAALREIYMLNHQDKCTGNSNIVYPEGKEGQISIVGFLKTKEETNK